MRRMSSGIRASSARQRSRIVGHGFGRLDAHAVEHDRPEQRRSGKLFLGAGDRVADGDAVLEAAKDLLAAGKAALADGKLHAAFAAEFGELVDDIERRRVAGHGEVRADAKDVDRRSGGDEVEDHEFVQPAARHDLHVRQPRLVEDLPGRL